MDLGLAMLLAGVVGARLLHVFADGYFWDYVHLCTDPSKVIWPVERADCLSAAYGGVWDAAAGVCHPSAPDCFAWAKFWGGGLVYYGGFLGASAAAWILLKHDAFPFWKAADMAGFERAMQPFCATVEQGTCLITDQRPNSIVNYARIDGTPEVLAGILALLGLAVLAQFAVASARRRRRDFAILRTLGLLRGQLIAITAWQAAAMTALALLVGLPLGVAGGHWAWGLFAGEAGLSTGAITPLPLLLLTAPVAITAAIAVTLPSGRRSARLNPAAVLRSE